jgi:hypothetical protein
MNKLAILILAGFALMVIDGDKSAYRLRRSIPSKGRFETTFQLVA